MHRNFFQVTVVSPRWDGCRDLDVVDSSSTSSHHPTPSPPLTPTNTSLKLQERCPYQTRRCKRYVNTRHESEHISVIDIAVVSSRNRRPSSSGAAANWHCSNTNRRKATRTAPYKAHCKWAIGFAWGCCGIWRRWQDVSRPSSISVDPGLNSAYPRLQAY